MLTPFEVNAALAALWFLRRHVQLWGARMTGSGRHRRRWLAARARALILHDRVLRRDVRPIGPWDRHGVRYDKQ